MIHPLMIFLCALGCVGFLLSEQWTAAAWPFIAAVWVWMHRSEQRMNERLRNRMWRSRL